MEEREFIQHDLERRINSLEPAAEAGLVKCRNLSQTIAKYTVEVLWVCADRNTIAMEYSFNYPGHNLYWMPLLTGDKGQIYWSGGGKWGKGGRAHYSYTREKETDLVDTLNLHFELLVTTTRQFYRDWISWIIHDVIIARRNTLPDVREYVKGEPQKPTLTDEVFGPFSFDFSVPVYDFSETSVNQTITVEGVPVTLERVRLTPLQAQFVFDFDQAANPQILAKDLFTGMKLEGDGWEMPAAAINVERDGKVWTSSSQMFLCDITGEVNLHVGNTGYRRIEGYKLWATPQPDGTPTTLPPQKWREIVLPGPWVFKFTMPVVEPQL